MLFKNITVLNEKYDVEEGLFVGVRDAQIAYMGKEMPREDFGRSYDGKGKLLMSAFYNCHGHSPMTLMRGYGENMPLDRWLNDLIFPFEAKLDSEAVYWGTLLAMAESLRFGIVSTSDMYYFIDDMVRAIGDSGAKANISRAIVNFDYNDVWQLPSMQEMERTFKEYHNAFDERIKMDVSIHGEYTSNYLAVEAVSQFGKENDTIMHVHISETKGEHEGCKERNGGLTPVQYFAKHGAFDIPTVAAHCVYVEDDDLEILRSKGVTVATNPTSNMKLASGLCDAYKIKEAGINLALGTDSVASNNSLNFFESMKLLAISSKLKSEDPTVFSPEEVLHISTGAGAAAQGRADCGAVKVGNRADLIVVDIHKPNMYPVFNLQNNLVYSASGSDIAMTMADGKVLYEGGEYTTIDIEKTMFEAESAAKRLRRMV